MYCDPKGLGTDSHIVRLLKLVRVLRRNLTFFVYCDLQGFGDGLSHCSCTVICKGFGMYCHIIRVLKGLGMISHTVRVL